jgi:hypothetical protein
VTPRQRQLQGSKAVHPRRLLFGLGNLEVCPIGLGEQSLLHCAAANAEDSEAGCPGAKRRQTLIGTAKVIRICDFQPALPSRRIDRRVRVPDRFWFGQPDRSRVRSGTLVAAPSRCKSTPA